MKDYNTKNRKEFIEEIKHRNDIQNPMLWVKISILLVVIVAVCQFIIN